MVNHDMVLLYKHGIYAEGNMENIYPTIMIDISRTSSKIENVYIGVDCSPEEYHIYIDLLNQFWDVFTWSYEEMPRIDPNIFKHDIKTYMDAKLV